MHGLQVGIQLVERMPQAVGEQIDSFGLEARRRWNAAPRRALNCVLVGVVTEMEDEIQILPEHVAIGRVEPARPVLTGCKREPQLAYQLVRSGRGPEMANRAFLAADIELVEVIASRPKPVDFGVDRVCQVRGRDRDAAGNDQSHPAVGRHPPPHRDASASETVRHGRFGRQAGPQDDAVGRGIAGCHTKCEGVLSESARGEQIVAGQESKREAGADPAPGSLEKPSSVDCRFSRLSAHLATLLVVRRAGTIAHEDDDAVNIVIHRHH
jgi:hypothetical protein